MFLAIAVDNLGDAEEMDAEEITKEKEVCHTYLVLTPDTKGGVLWVRRRRLCDCVSVCGIVVLNLDYDAVFIHKLISYEPPHTS